MSLWVLRQNMRMEVDLHFFANFHALPVSILEVGDLFIASHLLEGDPIAVVFIFLHLLFLILSQGQLLLDLFLLLPKHLKFCLLQLGDFLGQ
mmetsp:Transcript_24954/g.24417  ORF Transcript_24954/g.24417 Transcript_24954/m.24417 type:complete len:92 (-) Transcript_24954:47-322(-)